jgi:hypothetical protein
VGVHVEAGPPVSVTTGTVSWSYATAIPVHSALTVDADSWYWARLDVEVLSGQVGVGWLVGDDLQDEHLIAASQGRTSAFLLKQHATAGSLDFFQRIAYDTRPTPIRSYVYATQYESPSGIPGSGTRYSA